MAAMTATMERSDHILIVDDDAEIRSLLTRYLEKNGLRATAVGDGRGMWRALDGGAIDLIVLDLMLPGDDGLTLCRTLRAQSDLPVIMLTARGDETDRIVGLEMGADDYLPKPFEPRELAVRLQTILRRARSAPAVDAQPLDFEGLHIDLARRQVRRLDQPVELTGTEFELLVLLAREPQKVFDRDQILNRLRGHEAELHTRAVDILVSRLRRKLEPLDCIKTLRNAGYAFAGVRA